MTFSPQPVPPSSAPGRGAGFWILVIGGCAGLCGVLLVGGLVLLGVLGAMSEESPAPAAPGAPGAPAPTAASASGEPDDFIYKSDNGLEWIAPNEIVAEGVAVPLAGTWCDDHRHIVLRLEANGRYQLSAGGGAIRAGNTKADITASSSAEQGTWALDGATLTLSPDGYRLTGIAEGKQTSGNGAADPPRQWSVVGVTIAYTPHGQDTPRQRPGLRVRGPSPTWYYPSGEMNWVLRSVR